eukprot:SAG11_NODE_805_length_7090_cov_11.551995_1_plen_61_part_00
MYPVHTVNFVGSVTGLLNLRLYPVPLARYHGSPTGTGSLEIVVKILFTVYLINKTKYISG